jgi:hypothetical protein
LTADHGVGPTPEWARENGIDAGRGPISTRVRAAVETALVRAYGPAPEGKRYVTHVGEWSCFFDEHVLQAKRGTDELSVFRLAAARVAAEAASRVPGMMTAFATDDLSAPAVEEDALRTSLMQALCPGRAGDVQLVIKPYWLDGMTPASHGTPHAYDREVVGLAMGPGIRAGHRSETTITPGFGVVLFSAMLGMPTPSPTTELVPDAFFDDR